MKRRVLFSLLFLCACLLTACGGADAKNAARVPLEELPGGYTVEQAKADGCVVHEGGDVTSGQEVWEAFAETVSAGKAASVRLASYYTLDDPSRYDPEYYESVKDRYPLLFIQDLTYDGAAYTLRWFEEDGEILETYQYLMRYEGEAESPHAAYGSYVRYVLTNDDSVTWEKLVWGMLSSRFGDYIPHHSAYTDLIWRDETP